MKALREALALSGLLAAVVYLCLRWHSLPAILPSHYGYNGMPNRFAPKGMLWALVGTGVLLYLFMLLPARFPRYFNLPKPVGHPDRPRLEALAIDMMGWIRLEMAWMFAYLILQTIRTGTHQGDGIGTFFIPLLFVVMATTIAAFFWRAKSGNQPGAFAS